MQDWPNFLQDSEVAIDNFDKYSDLDYGILL